MDDNKTKELGEAIAKLLYVNPDLKKLVELGIRVNTFLEDIKHPENDFLSSVGKFATLISDLKKINNEQI